MTVLITGAHGQLGQDIIKECESSGIPYIAADSHTLDITNNQSVLSFVKTHAPDTVINCAAFNAVDRAETEWRRAYSVNGIGVRNLALAIRDAEAVFVHYSTDYVFDGNTTNPYTIADAPNPLCRYGKSKLLGEQEVLTHSDRFFLIRTSWVFGRGNVNFPRKVLEWSRDRDALSIVNDQISSPTYTRDLARATLALCETADYGLYHITNKGSCSRYEWARFILEKIRWKGSLSPAQSSDFPTPALRPSFSVLDNFGSPEVLGYDLPSWETATEDFLKELDVIP